MIAAERRSLLAQRRGLLIQRAALQRQALGAAAAPLLPAWQAAECGLLLWRGVRQRRWLLALPLGVLLVWRPRVGSGLALLPLAWRVWSRIARS